MGAPTPTLGGVGQARNTQREAPMLAALRPPHGHPAPWGGPIRAAPFGGEWPAVRGRGTPVPVPHMHGVHNGKSCPVPNPSQRSCWDPVSGQRWFIQSIVFLLLLKPHSFNFFSTLNSQKGSLVICSSLYHDILFYIYDIIYRILHIIYHIYYEMKALKIKFRDCLILLYQRLYSLFAKGFQNSSFVH